MTPYSTETGDQTLDAGFDLRQLARDGAIKNSVCWNRWDLDNPLEFTDPTGLVIDPDTLGIGSNSNTISSTPSHDSNGNSSSTSGAGSLPDDKRPTSGRIPQTWLPNGKTACYWRSLIAILEEELNYYLINNELIALRNKGLESDLGIDDKKTLGADNKVGSWQKVLGDAFSLYDREINPYAGSSIGAKAGIIKLSKVDETNILSGEYRDTSLEFAYGIANHYQLANKSGSL